MVDYVCHYQVLEHHVPVFCFPVLQVLLEWTNLPAGVKFDPTDVELLDHLAAKCQVGNVRSNMFIDKFIITLAGEGGICYTHPENLPGVQALLDLLCYLLVI